MLSTLLAKRVLFRDVTDVSALVDVQWTYLGIALFDVLLAVVFYYLPIPEASDEDLEELANRRREDNHATPLGFNIPVINITLALGIWSQFFYVAAQEVFSTSFSALLNSAYPNPPLTQFTYLTIGRSVFAIGRFLAALSQCFLKPRLILLLSYIGMVISSALCMTTKGSAAIAMAMLVFLFESGTFSMIFAISLRGMGKHTKSAGTLLTLAVSGGAFLPFARFAAQRAARSVPHSYAILVALFAAGSLFPIYLNLVPAAKKQVDPVPNEHLRHAGRRRRARHRQNNTTTNNKSSSRGIKSNVLTRERANPSTGGVYSRRRSVLDNDDGDADPLPTVDFSGPNSVEYDYEGRSLEGCDGAANSCSSRDGSECEEVHVRMTGSLGGSKGKEDDGSSTSGDDGGHDARASEEGTRSRY